MHFWAKPSLQQLLTCFAKQIANASWKGTHNVSDTAANAQGTDAYITCNGSTADIECLQTNKARWSYPILLAARQTADQLQECHSQAAAQTVQWRSCCLPKILARCPTEGHHAFSKRGAKEMLQLLPKLKAVYLHAVKGASLVLGYDLSSKAEVAAPSSPSLVQQDVALFELSSHELHSPLLYCKQLQACIQTHVHICAAWSMLLPTCDVCHPQM